MSSSQPSLTEYANVHADPQGPGDDRPTAYQIVKNEGLLSPSNRLSGKTVLVTGGTSGLGLEIAKTLHLTGAKVFISGRCDQTKGVDTAASIDKAASSSAASEAGPLLHPVQFVRMDLSDLSSVRDGATQFLKAADNKVDLLICNAGVMSVPTFTPTAQGHETQFGVNYLAHFLLFKILCPALLASSASDFASRVISVSSCAHRGGALIPDGDYDFSQTKYDGGAAYAQSKTANIYMANELERRYGAQGLHGLSPHPGVIMETGLVRHMTDDVDKFTAQMAEGMPAIKGHLKSAPQGAASIVWAAVAGSLEGAGGLFLEDCGVAKPLKDEHKDEWFRPGMAEWCYDEAAEKKLWVDSEEMVKAYL